MVLGSRVLRRSGGRVGKKEGEGREGGREEIVEERMDGIELQIYNSGGIGWTALHEYSVLHRMKIALR